MYGPAAARPAHGDVSGSFECRAWPWRRPVPAGGQGQWSNHAYGRGDRPEPGREPLLRRLRPHPRGGEPPGTSTGQRARPGMVTPAVVRAFRCDRLGVGRRWTGNNQGLHALLGDRREAFRRGETRIGGSSGQRYDSSSRWTNRRPGLTARPEPWPSRPLRGSGSSTPRTSSSRGTASARSAWTRSLPESRCGQDDAVPQLPVGPLLCCGIGW